MKKVGVLAGAIKMTVVERGSDLGQGIETPIITIITKGLIIKIIREVAETEIIEIEDDQQH